MQKKLKLKNIFYPKSVAVIGASAELIPFIPPILEGKLKGKIFLVNPKYKEFTGLKCYSSILDIHGPIDYAIIGVPAKVVPKVIRDCIKKGVKTAHIYSSGFSETGEEDRIELEREIAKIAKGKIRLIGPNCMGIYCPDSGLYFNEGQSKESGPVGFVSQSGTFAVYFTTMGELGDVRFSKVISYGNAVDLDCLDFIEYLADDPKTRIILVYIEGVRDGRRLFEVLKEITRKKPVLLLKGGTTSEGAKAVSSHTGALAGSKEVWEAFCKQTGVISVKSYEEMVDTVRAFLHSPPPHGRGISIASVSGGISVVETDACVEIGLEVPRFSDRTLEKLKEIIPIAGTSIKNPLDIWPAFMYGTLPDAIEIATFDENIHSIILEPQMSSQFRDLVLTDDYVRGLAKKCKDIQNRSGKPIMISAPPDLDYEFAYRVRKIFQDVGLTVFQSISRAAKAIFNLYLCAEKYGE